MFYEDVLSGLIRAGVRFVIVGGFLRTSADLHLAVDLDEANLRQLVDCVTALGLRPRAPLDANELVSAERIVFHRPGHPLDDVYVHIIESAVSFGDLVAHAEHFELEGMELCVASVEDPVTHSYPLEKLLAFRAVPTTTKLAWLEERRRFQSRLRRS
jgi:hypothetical protein